VKPSQRETNRQREREGNKNKERDEEEESSVKKNRILKYEINVLPSFPKYLNSHLIFQELELVHGIKLKMFCA
jgi:hypothetical protein